MAHNTTSDRAQWLRTEGFALYNDVNDRILETADTLVDAAPLTMHDLGAGISFRSKKISAEPAAVSLFITMNRACNYVRDLRADRRDTTFYDSFEISEQDRDDSSRFTFEHGFADLAFPWYFPAAVANSAVNHFVSQDVITKEQKDRMGLHDWANIIGSGWFSTLNHDLAFTRSGLYGTYGNKLSAYTKGSFQELLTYQMIVRKGEDVFDYEEQVEPAENMVCATVGLSRVATQSLRRLMRNSESSIGCPVARTSVRFTNEQVAENPHIGKLLEDEQLKIVPERSDGESTRATQEWTAIDKTLAFFAMQLDNYAERNGTPRLIAGLSSLALKHVQTPPMDGLRWPVQELQPVS